VGLCFARMDRLRYPTVIRYRNLNHLCPPEFGSLSDIGWLLMLDLLLLLQMIGFGVS